MSQIRKNPFEVLGLSKSADDEEIKRTYLKLAKQYHPDVNPNYSEKFKEINEAYNLIKDPTKVLRRLIRGNNLLRTNNSKKDNPTISSNKTHSGSKTRSGTMKDRSIVIARISATNIKITRGLAIVTTKK